jgi:Putative transmembrane protein (PGPGW)
VGGGNSKQYDTVVMELNVLADSFGVPLYLELQWRIFGKDVPVPMLFKSLQQTKRFLKILFGFTLLVLGVAMLVTPGPGWLVIALGLGVLAAEFVWARRLLDHLKEQGDRLKDHGVRLRNTILSHVSADRA